MQLSGATREKPDTSAIPRSSNALERLDRTYYRTLREAPSPRGYVCGNLPIDAIGDVVEEYRALLGEGSPCPDCGNHIRTDGHKFDCSLIGQAWANNSRTQSIRPEES
jgi:hypothetical protein